VLQLLCGQVGKHLNNFILGPVFEVIPGKLALFVEFVGKGLLMGTGKNRKVSGGCRERQLKFCERCGQPFVPSKRYFYLCAECRGIQRFMERASKWQNQR